MSTTAARYITDLIKGFFDTYRTKFQSSLTILQAEFVIWKEIQLEMASEGFYSQLLANLDETDKKGKMKSFRKLLLQEKLDSVREFLNSNPQP